MAKLSDIIEAFIKQMINTTDGTIEIGRNDLANKFNCVPSQINYVISTRFTNVQGYYVESKRGGGGHIRIKRVDTSTKGSYIMHIISSMGDSITQQVAEIFINNFVDYEIISLREAMIIKASISDNVLKFVSKDSRDTLRALLFKNIIVSIFE